MPVFLDPPPKKRALAKPYYGMTEGETDDINSLLMGMHGGRRTLDTSSPSRIEGGGDEGPCADSYARDVLFRDLGDVRSMHLLKSPMHAAMKRGRGRLRDAWSAPCLSFRGSHVPYSWVCDKEMPRLREAVSIMYGCEPSSNNRRASAFLLHLSIHSAPSRPAECVLTGDRAVCVQGVADRQACWRGGRAFGTTG